MHPTHCIRSLSLRPADDVNTWIYRWSSTNTKTPPHSSEFDFEVAQKALKEAVDVMVGNDSFRKSLKTTFWITLGI
ncbi:hypothetical protein AX14_004429 [Amanita brunnescens Koide BX004]|nr:hypothetical protein AX14_004429 [Amanita brunnescens Koide BX004]